jgi:hypothetical protein
VSIIGWPIIKIGLVNVGTKIRDIRISERGILNEK